MGCGGSKKTEVEVAPTTEPPTAAASKEAAPDDATTKAAVTEEQGEDIRDKYDIGAVLGSGSFGQVREARLKPDGGPVIVNEVRAVKMIERDDGDGEWSNHAIFVREVGLLQQIKHENIIRYFDFYEDPHFLYVVMELCTGGEVFAKIVELKRFSEKNASMIGQQMLKAMDYIHKLSICHRDIKAENFMLSEPHISSSVKMIDFGMATKFKSDQTLTELCGSPHYLAPELIGQKYNHMADVWAFGILLYLLMYGHYPYDAKHPRDIMVKILTEPIVWQSKAKLSTEAIDFLKQLLEHNPKKRLSAAQALEHPWIGKSSSSDESTQNTLCVEAVRSAHKKVTATKKALDPKVDKLRNEKLKRLDEDFKAGVRNGRRLGETPKEDFMSKPEFLRRENKITTAPSQHLNSRRVSMENMKNKFLGKSGLVLETIPDKDAGRSEAAGAQDKTQQDKTPENTGNKQEQGRGEQRSHSLKVSSMPRRLSYMPDITPQVEKNLASLFEEKSGTSSKLEEDSQKMTGVLPGSPNAAPVPNLESKAKAFCTA